ncbi:hypothetical protein ACZ11_16750 [Lysinibacillus xylanilyticus]|uniref:Uncharacterized protein n=1 Tax=Lysinibacillus xylanilyticus TaxID=582475 RepID=A0A0K9F800_9BACI|nr:hypothetical protein ACZ11_16750 [Lysinibacillus xylanilyticus]
MISVPTTRFAAEAPLSHRAKLPGASGQQIFFARKRSVNEASAAGCFLRESVVLTKRQRQDVGHEGVITGRDGFSLRSSIAGPQGVAQYPLQSTYIHDNVLTNVILNFFLNFTNVKI